MRSSTYPSGTPPPPPPSNTGPIAGAPAQMSGLFPGSVSRSLPWELLALLSKILGLLALFVGTLVSVLFGSFPADCFNSTACSLNTSAGIQYAILASRLLFSIGAFGLIVGGGIRLHFVLGEPSADTAESTARLLDERRRDFLFIVLGVAILLVLLVSEAAAVAPRL